ncbi:hypothetical protein [Actinoplanes rectilineatus]|uniref:hypothetical protein n=1 Tax=Actinoplanes rectilineatus TaxID=113571 RepID=UPI0005F2CD10|nr:hypothetical protein [Actinoplanes rectilineatus]
MDELQERISARLAAVVEHQVRTGAEVGEGRAALVDELGVPRLSLDDLARLAADEARAWF